MKILIADDDQTIVMVLEKLILSWGHTLVSAYNGKHALTLLQQQQDITIAILDWQMPEMLGIDVIRHIRASQPDRSLYLILLTSNREKIFLMEAFESGADDYLSKPLDADILRARLKAGERNISAQHQLIERNQLLDEEVQHRTVDLSNALALAEHASEMKSHFLANMSHEIRTPLNGILSYIELLTYSEITDEQSHDLQIIRSCAHSLRTVINDVLDFSKIEAGRMLIEHSPFSVSCAVAEIVDLLKVTAMDKQIEIISSAEIKNDIVVGDKIRFQQILTNLLSNAIKFSYVDRVISISVQNNEAPSSFHSFTGGIHLSVIDSGIGIPSSKYEQIFDSFTQADSSTTRKFGGTGLGLTIIKKLCALMDGCVWVESIVGVGSTFHVILPFPAADATHPIHTKEVFEDINFEGTSVLLAEDNFVNQQAIKRILERTGCIVRTANNGRDVVDEFCKSPSQIVLLDIQMPMMGGEEAARKLRELTKNSPRLPIVALTANIFQQDIERYAASGIDEILGKPISYPDLFQVMKRYLTFTFKNQEQGSV